MYTSHICRYRIPSNKRPQCLLTFGTLSCGAYWRVAHKSGRQLSQNQRNYLHEISKLNNFLFPSNNPQLPLYLVYIPVYIFQCISSVYDPELLVIFNFS